MEQLDTTVSWTTAYLEWMDMEERNPGAAREQEDAYFDLRKQDLFCEAMMLLSSLHGCDRRQLHGEGAPVSGPGWNHAVEGIATNMHALAAKMLALQGDAGRSLAHPF